MAEPVVHLDPDTLAPTGISIPCPASVVAHLGIADPAGIRVPCGLLAGHRGDHVFHIEWSDPAPKSSLADRLAASETKLRRPR